MKRHSPFSAVLLTAAKLSFLIILIGAASLSGLPTTSTPVRGNEQTHSLPESGELTNAMQADRCFSCPLPTTLGTGLQLFSNGRKIKVTILLSDAALTSNIYVRPCPTCPPIFLGTNRQTGNMTCLDTATFPAGTEYVFEIETETGNRFQTGPGSRNPIDGLGHAVIQCQLDKPIIEFEDLPGLGSDRDFNDVRLEVSCCDDKCDFPLFYSPDYFMNPLHRMPGGAVFIGGVNYNAPVSTRNADAMKFALNGGGLFGTNPLQQLNREYVAAQLSLAMAGGDGSPAAYNSLWSPLRCLGPIGPVRLGNGFLFDSNSMLKDLFIQTRLAILQNRAVDYGILADFFNDLHCNNPFPRADGGICLLPIAYPDLLPLQTRAGYCDRTGNQLTVTVRNASSVSAACSVVRVEFSTGHVEEKDVPTVPAFGSTSVTIDIPTGCFSPDCTFRIIVNSKGCGGSPRIIESRRSNNTVSGTCIG